MIRGERLNVRDPERNSYVSTKGPFRVDPKNPETLVGGIVPSKHRGCTDIGPLLVFIAFWVMNIVIIGVSVKVQHVLSLLKILHARP